MGIGAGSPSGLDGNYGIMYGLCRLRYKVLSLVASTAITITGARYYNAMGIAKVFDIVDVGQYNQPTPPPPVPEFPLGAEAATGIGFMVAIAYIWWRSRKTKPTITKHLITQTPSQ